MNDRVQKLSGTNFWNELIKLRDEQRAERENAAQVVKRSDLPLEVNSQGLMRWYMHPAIKDVKLSTLAIYEQELPPRGRSGRLKFQGGQILFIVEGNGYTARFLDVEPNLYAATTVDRGCGFAQLEPAPDYRA